MLGLEDPDMVGGALDGVPSAVPVAETLVPPMGGGIDEDADALTSFPVPHGIFSPSGCVDCVGAIMSFALSVIVKRPVQRLSVDAGLENW